MKDLSWSTKIFLVRIKRCRILSFDLKQCSLTGRYVPSNIMFGGKEFFKMTWGSSLRYAFKYTLRANFDWK